MLPDDTRIEIENIVSGIILEGRTDHCTTIRNSFCCRYETSTVVKAKFESKAIIKKEQADFIEAYCTEHSFWMGISPDEERYLTRGGESKVYLANTRFIVYS